MKLFSLNFTWLKLRFSDIELEHNYRMAEDAKALRLMRIGLIVGGLVFLTGCVLVLANVAMLSSSVSLGMSTTQFWQAVLAYTIGTVLLYPATYSRLFLNHPQPALAALSVAAAGALAVWVAILPTDFVYQRGYMFLLIHLFTIYGLLRMRLLPAALAGWMSTLVFMVLLHAATEISVAALARQLFWLMIGNIWGMVICHQMEWALRREFVAKQELDRAHARAEGLLLNILPAAIASRLKLAPGTVAEQADAVTVLFGDLVGFTPLAARKSPIELVALLDRVFREFDLLAGMYGLEKIKTIGDAYMAVAGLPLAQNDHALRAANMALAMVDAVKRLAVDSGEDLEIRIGLHSGPVVAGVIGHSKFSYDLWGDTVNLASRLESLSQPGRVQCSVRTANLLAGQMELVPRGTVEVKGKGSTETFFIIGPSDSQVKG